MHVLHQEDYGDETQPLVRNQHGGGQFVFCLTIFIAKNPTFSLEQFHSFGEKRMDDYGEDVGWDEAAVR